MGQSNDTYNEYDTTVNMVAKYILTNTIQVNMAETRFYKNLSNSKKKVDEQGVAYVRESMVLKSARFRIYNNDSGAVYSHAEKVRKAEEVRAALERIKKNSATNYELNNRFKDWKENNTNYNDIMFAIGESQIEKLHSLGLSFDKLTSHKEGYEHVKAVLKNAVQAGEISPEQEMSYKLGTWHYLKVPKLRSNIEQKQNSAAPGKFAPPFPPKDQDKTAVTQDSSISSSSIPSKTPEALLAAQVVLDEIIKRCKYPEGTQLQPEKILPILNIMERKGLITKEERPAFEKTLQPLLNAAPAKEQE